MRKVGFDNIKKIHFIGIGGIGISALAGLLFHDGKEISGTNDSESHETLDELRKQGVPISLNQAVLPNADLYIYSDAWLTLNPRIIEKAKESGIPTLSYFEALGIYANQYYVIAVSGMHGKTTTTAMLVDIFEAAGKDPTAVIGSIRAKTGLNYRAGKSKYFIVEADEYRRHFLNFRPDILIILNIDRDHLDYYKDLADIQDAFRTLVKQMSEKGFVVTDRSSHIIKPVLEGVSAQVIDYKKYIDLNIKLKNPGLHNYTNAAVAMAAAACEKLNMEMVKKALEDFSGVWRRFEYKGKTESGAVVYDDYAHHPAEIKATLKAFREKFPDRIIIVLFQPHLFSRTKILFEDFAKSFSGADEVVFAPIYAAREKSDGSVSSEQLAQAVSNYGLNTHYFNSFIDIENYLHEHAGENNLVITMGAGDIYKVGEALVKK